MKDQFLRHIVFWLLILPFFAITLMPAFMNESAMKLPASEQHTLIALGQDPIKVTERANTVFSSTFIDTGIVAMSRKLFFADPSQFLRSDTPNVSKEAVNMTSKYFDGFWHMIYRAIWRVLGLWGVLSVLLLAVVIPAIIDGLSMRGANMDQYKPNNPVFFWASTHTAISVMGLFLFLPFLPFAISVYLLYGIVAVVALMLWTSANNLQTGT